MANAKGRPPKSPIDEFRTLAWYRAVSSRGWSDTELDVEFIRGEDGTKKTSADRIRYFEKMTYFSG